MKPTKHPNGTFFNWFYVVIILLVALAVLVWYCYQLKLEILEKEIKTPRTSLAAPSSKPSFQSIFNPHHHDPETSC